MNFENKKIEQLSKLHSHIVEAMDIITGMTMESHSLALSYQVESALAEALGKTYLLLSYAEGEESDADEA